jgi:hypothetical protein
LTKCVRGMKPVIRIFSENTIIDGGSAATLNALSVERIWNGRQVEPKGVNPKYCAVPGGGS